MVLEGTTIRQRRLALKTLPASLAEAFACMIDRIKKLPLAQAKLGMQVLLWLHMAYRPFTLEELEHALAVEPGDTELDTDNIPSAEIMLSCCLGLVIVDEETLTVRFVHYSLEEFFKDDENTNKYFPDRFTSAAEICLTYLNFGRVSPRCRNVEELARRQEEFPFLKYAAEYWGHYVRLQSHDGVTELALNLLLVCSVGSLGVATHCALQALYFSIIGWGTEMFSGTHMAAYFGLHIYMPHLAVYDGWDMKDCLERTPLIWAAGYGHKEVVQLLLKQERVEVNSNDTLASTPLSLAVINGHEAIVQLLLQQEGVEVNAEDGDGRTPLPWAAIRGHEAVVRLLLQHEGVDVNAKVDEGLTPLSLAAEQGHEAVVRLLLQHEGVDVNAKDNVGRTPLLLAAKWGCEAVVWLLLQHEGVDVNATDDEGQRPLLSAAKLGCEDSVRLLLQHEGVDVNAKDNVGRTPLLLAAKKGYEAVVRLLLQQEDVEVNAKDDEGQTPLLWAANKGNEAVVRLLVERGAIDTRYNRTDIPEIVQSSW